MTAYDSYMRKQALRAEDLFRIAKNRGIGGDWRYAGKMLARRPVSRPLPGQAQTMHARAHTPQDLGFMPDRLARNFLSEPDAMEREFSGAIDKEEKVRTFFNRGEEGRVSNYPYPHPSGGPGRPGSIWDNTEAYKGTPADLVHSHAFRRFEKHRHLLPGAIQSQASPADMRWFEASMLGDHVPDHGTRNHILGPKPEAIEESVYRVNRGALRDPHLAKLKDPHAAGYPSNPGHVYGYPIRRLTRVLPW